MPSEVSRRHFLKWTGIVVAGAPFISACSHGSSSRTTLPLGEVDSEMGPDESGSFTVNGKTYPYKDPATGELLYHDPIRFTPYASLKRTPLTSPADLLTLQPTRIMSSNGSLAEALVIAYANATVNGQIVNLRTYNGTFPGPTLVASPGDVLSIEEQNVLPAEADEEVSNVNEPHGFNVVNLHTHGMNVNPNDSEDNIFLQVHPGETFAHQIHVPADHPTGSFWYHPHKHGGTGCQVGSGMAGFLLMTNPKTDIRSLPQVGAAKEVELVFQEIYIQDNPDGTGFVPGVPVAVEGFFYGSKIRSEMTVNGTACQELTDNRTVMPPELHMQPGEVQHWRMVNAGVFQNWLFAIDGHQSNIIAYDGITPDTVDTVDQFLFSPGQRRDILVKASTTPGTYAVKRKAYKQAEQVNTWPEFTLFNLIVEGSPLSMALPTTLNPPRARLPYIADSEVVYKRTIAFSFFDNTEENIFIFKINDNVFTPGRVDFTMVLNNTEEWTITNDKSSDHPFHIHINWFELLSSTDGHGNRTVYDPPLWMDTANIPAGGQLVTRMRFQEFQGKAVFHCHFLNHEDEGMMATIEIVDGTPKTTVITPAGGTVLSQDYENRVQVRFLPGSVGTPTAITYQYLASPEAPTVNAAPDLPKGLADYNTFFRLSATQGGASLAEFARPVTMEVKFSSAQAQANVPADNVYLYRYDETLQTWTQAGVSMISATDDLITCSATMPGIFGVSGVVAPGAPEQSNADMAM